MGAEVGVKGLEEADASAVLGEGMADSGQRAAARRECGGTDIMPGGLSQNSKLFLVYPGRNSSCPTAFRRRASWLRFG
jgi:hypothetical protein